VLRKLAKVLLRRRVIALTAAYAIALSSVLASFSAAQAAAEAINQPGGVLCHNSASAQPALPANESKSKICVDWCCVGCLTMATAVPPPVPAAALTHALSQRLAPLARVVLAGGTDFNAHRSRGPPPAR